MKISNLPTATTITANDLIAFIDSDSNPIATDKISFLNFVASVFNNVPTGAIPGSVFDYVISGGVWTGDAYGSTRAASMTAMTVYINSRTISISAVTARTFTASKDTYIDVLDNLDGTGTLVYTEVSNNAASPALASNSLRIGIIVTGASTIANAGSVNQGQEDKILPIASSIAYSVTDSLGNLICPRDPNRKLLGYKEILADQTGITGPSDITGLAVPIIILSGMYGRKIKVRSYAKITHTTADGYITHTINEGATQINAATANSRSGSIGETLVVDKTFTPSVGSHTYKAQAYNNAAGTVAIRASATACAFIEVTLE